jgi:hypothetical protein
VLGVSGLRGGCAGFDIAATLQALAAQEELEALCDRALNAQTVVDLRKLPA